MSDTIIKVENLSKRYRIGLQEKKADTFAQQLWNNLKAPVKNFQRIKSLGKFDEEEESVHWALKDVSFEVKQGEVLGIIGKNGAGKSTLLKILSKITEPTSGRIEMNGRVAALLEVGTGFHPELTGRENIYMNGTILGMTKKEIDRKLDEIIDFSGVEKYVDTPVKFYSSGMRVRLGFSVAAHLEPEILIIDEVLAVGDFEFQKKCLGKMKDVSVSGRTVLFVSHNLEAVKNLCDRVLLIENGIIVKNDRTTSVIDFYLQKSISSNRKIEWDFKSAPGDDMAKFKSVELIGSNSGEKNYIDREEDFEISIWFWILEFNQEINLSLRFFTGTGECLMNLHSQLPGVKLDKGLHNAKCLIPGKLLNDGLFSISVMIVKDSSKVLCHVKDVLSFEVVETRMREMNWLGKIPGFIRPEINFSINSK
ncbi:ABC transporter ATP-binding protein [Algoriphagus formosus]|uniref:ABC transporter ATP-binding protein n=1 Tax=Algoriphagus formosus TaxID=2007308 RepID=UPI000C28D2AD|nr:ABC transporter ATP-binding protein [Algoriphagus formosus]